MKRILSFILCAVLIVALPVTSFAELDLSGMSYEELLALKEELDLAIEKATPDSSKPVSMTKSETSPLVQPDENGIYPSPILFRGAEWGATSSEVAKVLPEDFNAYEWDISEYWYSTDEWMYRENKYEYKGKLGYYETSLGSLENMKVAGYDIENVYIYYTYSVGEDGLLVRDIDHSALIYAYYKIEPKDPDAVYNDLISKLTSLYGDIDLHQAEKPYIAYEQNLWYGADGTMVSLVREDYPSGNHYIYIKYGFSGADQLLADAYEAAVYEESLFAASNTDGL